MAKTCIVCEGPAGSGEHIFPACLGGLRVNNGIYCGPHNEAYGPLAELLASQLAFYNAQFGIMNTRTKKIRPVTLKDGNGATYSWDGTELTPAGPRLVSQSDDQVTIALPANDTAGMQRFLAEQEAKGVKFEVANGGKPVAYHPSTLVTRQGFGAPEGLRAIGYLAQTFFTHCFRDLARVPAMRPFIDYTLNGVGGPLVWWDFEAPVDLPANAFELGHRIVVGIDADRGVAYGRVSLFSTFDYAIVFYELSEATTSRSFINDIDPIAEKMPDDLMQREQATAVASVDRPDNVTASLSHAISSGKAVELQNQLMRRSFDRRRRIVATDLLDLLNNASSISGKRQVLRNFWDGESQRIMRLLDATLKGLQSNPKRSDPGWNFLVRCLGWATQRDKSSPSGLAASAETAIKIASGALCHAMGESLENGKLDQDNTEMFIEGGLGQHAAADAVFKASLGP
jgi:hypothetical protein